MNEIHNKFRSQGLVRPAEGRLLAGVCAGLGRRFGVDPWPARLIFVLVLLLLPGSQILVYPLLWLLMPKESIGFVPSSTTQTPAQPASQA
jgi:phage shock protein PspC (stress-responsive transcriptional regulator)